MQNIAKLVYIFNLTVKTIKNTPELSRAVEKSIGGTKLYMAEESPEISRKKYDKPAEIAVTKYSTFQAALKLREKFPEAKIAVHNFASATSPGGGVTFGATAQEECLCRCSTLYPVLKTEDLAERYYKFHKKQRSALYTDACIYSPDILIIKSDGDNYADIPQEKWCAVDVMTCAAPNLSVGSVSGIAASIGMTSEKLSELHKSRAEHMLKIAAANGADVLVLGAFGCGAFGNDPEVVANAYKSVVSAYAEYFRHIEFAVYSPRGESRNYKIFNNILTK